MAYEHEIWEAAHRAEAGVHNAMSAYSDGTFSEEPAITGGLVMALRDAIRGDSEIAAGNLVWSAHILRSSRGVAAEESIYGADILFHVIFDAPDLRYSKGLLVQAKRVEPEQEMTTAAHADLVDQCNKMLSRTSAAYIFDYARSGMRCGSAMAIQGSSDRHLYRQCAWTPFRFFWELFRCFVGDSHIVSADPADLPIPNILQLIASDRVREPITERARLSE